MPCSHVQLSAVLRQCNVLLSTCLTSGPCAPVHISAMFTYAPCTCLSVMCTCAPALRQCHVHLSYVSAMFTLHLCTSLSSVHCSPVHRAPVLVSCVYLCTYTPVRRQCHVHLSYVNGCSLCTCAPVFRQCHVHLSYVSVMCTCVHILLQC